MLVVVMFVMAGDFVVFCDDTRNDYENNQKDALYRLIYYSK
jgi:hypothetical protein